MRNFKATLLLGAFTSGIVLVMLLGGCFVPLETAWKGLFHFSNIESVAMELLQGVLICFLSFMTFWVNIHLSRRRKGLLLFLFTALLLLTGSLVLALYHFWITPFSAEMALGLSYLFSLIFLRTDSGSRHPRLQRILGVRLNRLTIRKLVDGEMSLSFSGTLTQGSLLVCSINNHAELMESLEPEEYVSMTNLYLQTASDFLVDVGGYLEECSGESLRVIFGVPLALEGPANHGAKAARAAFDLVMRLDELNRECDARWQKRLDIRIGINSGEMISAVYGGTRLSHYSVAGPTVEFARYLGAACNNYGCRILVGPATYEMAEPTMEFRPIDLLQRKGLRRRVELYEVLAPKQTLSAERERSRDFFWQGIIFFREREWEKAVAAFTSARIPGIPDKVLDLYLERVDGVRRGVNELSPEQVVLTEAIF